MVLANFAVVFVVEESDIAGERIAYGMLVSYFSLEAYRIWKSS